MQHRICSITYNESNQSNVGIEVEDAIEIAEKIDI